MATLISSFWAHWRLCRGLRRTSPRRLGQRRSLKEKANNDCVFYDREAGCTVYPVRPRQCRTWPFWDAAAGTPDRWEETASECPGCNQGDLIPAEEITRRMRVIRI